MSNSKTIKILALRANPANTSPLRLDEEVREIKDELERAKYRDHLEFISEGAVRVKDLSKALMKYVPTIVHFSGHGAGENGLVLEDDNGQTKFVPTAALVELFRQYKTTVKCVFLNACYSEIQADAIYQQIDCVIGMNQPIGDKTAIRFAPNFYAALGWGRSFQEAFDYAKNDLQLDSNPQAVIPVLKIRQGATNLSFSTLESTAESTSYSVPQSQTLPPQQPQAQSSQSFGNVSFGGSNNSFNAIQAGGNVNLNQTSNQTSGGNDNLQAALEGLVKLKQEVAETATFSAFAKRDTESKITMLLEELQKPKPDKNFLNEVVDALKQGLNGIITLADPVREVAELIAKALVGMP